jgi:hypothetical protein
MRTVESPFLDFETRVHHLHESRLARPGADSRFLEDALALLPLSILDFLSAINPERGEVGAPLFGVCINYYSSAVENGRIGFMTEHGLIRTFCLKKDVLPENITAVTAYDECIRLYDAEDVFVSLLDCFYNSKSVSAAEDSKNFSMLQYLRTTKPGRDFSSYPIDEQKYKEDPKTYLRDHYAIAEGRWNYASYARFFEAASCLSISPGDPVYVNWSQSPKKDLWEKRHEGRHFVQYNIPIYSLDGEVISNIVIVSLLHFSEEDLSLLRVLAGNCIRNVSNYDTNLQLQNVARQSALASVMCRNLSHNVGSHVLIRLACPEPDLFDVTKHTAYDGMFNDVKMGTFDQIAYFNTYLRQRMDYLSDVAYRPPSSLFVRRIRNDLLRGLDRTRLLLNAISGLGENFKYGFSVDIQSKDRVKCKDNTFDLDVAVPNDVVGSHALYNILENVIRNTAKHSIVHQDQHRITLRFADMAPEEAGADRLYKVWVYSEEKLSSEEVKRFVDTMNGFIGKDVIEKGTVLRGEALGMIEMKASAAVLRQENVLSISPKYACKPDLFKAVAISASEDASQNQFYAGYLFYMLKPRDILLITRENKQPFLETLKNGVVCNYEFLVFDDLLSPEEIDELVSGNETLLPIRRLRMSDLQGGFLESRSCWKAWERKNAAVWPITTFRNSYSGKDDPQTTAILLSHNDTLENETTTVFQDLMSTHGRELRYLESFSSLAASVLPRVSEWRNLTDYVGHLSKAENKKSSLYCLWREIVNARVFIVDERVQEFACKESFDDVLYGVHYRKVGIDFPDKSQLDLQTETFTTGVSERLLSLIGGKVTEVDFLVIHYGLLERIFKSKARLANKESEWHGQMERQLNGWARERAHLVIESGRGIPKNLPDSVRFLSNSSLFSALTDYKSKAMLSMLLYSSRRAKL